VRTHLIYFGLGVRDCSHRKQHHSTIFPSTRHHTVQYPERAPKNRRIYPSAAAVLLCSSITGDPPPKSRNMYSLATAGSFRLDVQTFHELRPPYASRRTLPTRSSETIRASFDLNPSTYLIRLHASAHAMTRMSFPLIPVDLACKLPV
jgi:hypothetical protein